MIRRGDLVQATAHLGDRGEVSPGDRGVVVWLSGRGAARVRWRSGCGHTTQESLEHLQLAPGGHVYRATCGGERSRPKPARARARRGAKGAKAYCRICKGPHVYKHGRRS